MLQHTKQKHCILAANAKSKVLMKNLFDLNGSKSFHGYGIPLMKMLLIVELILCLAISFHEKYQELIIFIVNPLGTGQQQFLYLKYMFQVRKKKNQTNQFNYCIVKYGQLMMQFCLT